MNIDPAAVPQLLRDLLQLALCGWLIFLCALRIDKLHPRTNRLGPFVAQIAVLGAATVASLALLFGGDHATWGSLSLVAGSLVAALANRKRWRERAPDDTLRDDVALPFSRRG